ncbi:hypothetical protein [Actinokineospora diospyrosa]|uniref:Syntaxin 6, N-terminal n=1 Tax=Actinokineospora diospyrosa TaxID=103728 RepID=A0ABT1IDD9_9PSEU|nr:hypothetical protein [Actinokineospora diospyrosa]MCP2270576.1 Syntaxin 6, N-terminal [Actinokineospora diospyrosa]
MNPLAPLWRRVYAVARTEATAVGTEASREIEQLRTELTPKLDELSRQLTELTDAVNWLNSEHRRIAAQTAAIEPRLAEVEHVRPAVPVGSDNAVAGLVEEIREEHARIRTRLSLVARYEERLTRLEQGAE